MKYVVITPVRNEARHFQRTIDSMLAQTIPPTEWIVADDGSTDGTVELIAAAAARAEWITLFPRKDRGFRKPGAGVVEAFYDGYAQLRCSDWDLIVKLDGDLEFEPHYFEKLIREFELDPKLGISGGDIFHRRGAEIVIESAIDPQFHVRGANKAYRRACWSAMGGLFRVTGWDTLDEIKATMLGWSTRRIGKLRMLHLKPTGSADGSWKNAFKNGRGSYICGYHPLFLVARSSRRLLAWPPFVESVALLAGYFTGALARKPRVEDPQLIRYVRQQQLNKLLFRPSIW
jgi:poly-beta-1,6-N-acetyl-D-glucosamine synthase